MKIDIPILGFGRAGGYRVLSRLASEWIHRGHTVRFLCTQASLSPYFPTTAEIIWLTDAGKRVPLNSPEMLRTRGGILHVARNLCALFLGLCRHSHSADCILANHSLTAWPVFFCLSRARKYYYVQAYEAEFYANSAEGRKSVLMCQAWLSYWLPLRRIVNAPVYLNYRNLRAKDWVPPGVDFSLFRPRPAGAGPILTLACIGRKEPDKGTRDVLAAFVILKTQNPDVRLLVAYGNLPDGMNALEGVHVIVPANDGELAEFYRTADIFIAPALGQHGAPHYPVMEAMACGVPLITTGYLPATAENCWLVAEKDPVGIVGAIKAIQTGGADTQARVERALLDIREFRWEAVAARMLQVFSGGPEVANFRDAT